MDKLLAALEEFQHVRLMSHRGQELDRFLHDEETRRLISALRCMAMMDELRREEMDSIELVHDNPDFTGRPAWQCAVTWRHMPAGQLEQREWTFYSMNLEGALEQAVQFCRTTRHSERVNGEG